jgi:two-component system OmpR family sensor kinase
VSAAANHATAGGSPISRIWAAWWPEALWAVFAVANLVWMAAMPNWASIPFHLTWMSLLLIYGFGFRTWSRTLTWTLFVPVLIGTGLLFVNTRVLGLQVHDEVVELPLLAAILWAMMLHSRRRADAMAALAEVSRHNADLLERQRTFVQNASHELRTPITIALAHAELLDAPSTDDGADDRAVIIDELGRLHHLVDHLVLLAMAERSDQLRPETMRLVSLMDNVVHRWSAIPRRWLTHRDDDAVVSADPERLMLALDAIVENAVKVTGDGDRIELSVRRRGQEAAIVVSDSGPGIPQDQLDAVFDRFTRADPPGAAGGFGLGLSIVRGFAEAHGGRVTAAAGPLGGAQVTMWLPLAPPTDSTPDNTRSEPPAAWPAGSQ